MNKLIVIFTIIGILILFWFCFSSKQVPVEIDINAGNSPPIKIKENFEPNAMTKKIIENIKLELNKRTMRIKLNLLIFNETNCEYFFSLIVEIKILFRLIL